MKNYSGVIGRAVIYAAFVVPAGYLLLFLTKTSFSALPWAGAQDLYDFLSFLGLSFIIAFIGYGHVRSNLVYFSLSLFAIVALLSGNAWPFVVSLFFLASAYTLGDYIVCRICRDPVHRTASNKYLIGAGIYGTFTGLAAHFPINTPALYGVILFLPLLLSRGQAAARLMGTFSSAAIVESDRTLVRIVWALLLAFMLAHFVYALFPELGHDPLAMHLLVPTHLFYRQQWGFDPELYAWGLMPMLGNWIFSYGYMLAGEHGAKLVNFTFVGVMALQGVELARWAGANRLLSLAGALLFMTTPLVLGQSSSLNVDAIWGCFILAGALALLRGWGPCREDVRNGIRLAGIFLGFAAAAKAVTIPVLLPVLLLFIFLWWRFQLACRVSTVFQAGLLFFAIGGVPYITAYLISGNPIFPFFNGIFKSPYFQSENFNNVFYNSGLSFSAVYDITFNSTKYIEGTVGSPGFQWVCFFLLSLVVALRYRQERVLALFLFSILAVYVVFRSQSYLRYIFPFFVVMGSAVMASLSLVVQRFSMGKMAVFMGLFLVGTLNVMHFNSAIWTYRNFPIGILFSDKIRHQYLLSVEPIRLAVELVNTLNIERSPVAFYSKAYGAGLAANPLYHGWYNYKFFNLTNSAETKADLVKLFKDYGIYYVLLDEGWRTNAQRLLVESVTTEVMRYNSVAVRRLKDEYAYDVDFLKGAGPFKEAEWVVTGSVSFSDQSAHLSPGSLIAQHVSIDRPKRFVFDYSVKCSGKGTAGRLQISWLDKKNDYLTTDMRVFPCPESGSSHSWDVYAPGKAVAAIVSLVAVHEGEIEVSGLSLR